MQGMGEEEQQLLSHLPAQPGQDMDHRAGDKTRRNHTISCLCWYVLPSVGCGCADVPCRRAALHGTDKPLNIPSSSSRPASAEGEKANQVVETLSRAGWGLLTPILLPAFPGHCFLEQDGEGIAAKL